MSKLIRNVAPLEVTIRRSSSPRIGLLSHATPPPPPKGQLEESSVRIIDWVLTGITEENDPIRSIVFIDEVKYNADMTRADGWINDDAQAYKDCLVNSLSPLPTDFFNLLSSSLRLFG